MWPCSRLWSFWSRRSFLAAGVDDTLKDRLEIGENCIGPGAEVGVALLQ